MKCPNSDPGFNKIIGDRTPEERSKLFVICIIVRTLLYSGVYLYRNNPWVPILVGGMSVFSIFHLKSSSPEGRQWWSKKFQLLMSTLVLFAAFLVHIKKLDSRSMSVLLFISLLGGIFQRTHVTFC